MFFYSRIFLFKNSYFIRKLSVYILCCISQGQRWYLDCLHQCWFFWCLAPIQCRLVLFFYLCLLSGRQSLGYGAVGSFEVTLYSISNNCPTPCTDTINNNVNNSIVSIVIFIRAGLIWRPGQIFTEHRQLTIFVYEIWDIFFYFQPGVNSLIHFSFIPINLVDTYNFDYKSSGNGKWQLSKPLFIRSQ